VRTLQTWGGVRRIEATLYRWPNGRPLPLGIAVLLRTLLYVVAAVGAVILAGALPGVGVLVAMVAPIPRFMVPAARRSSRHGPVSTAGRCMSSRWITWSFGGGRGCRRRAARSGRASRDE
jgi:hypothetical protein